MCEVLEMWHEISLEISVKKSLKKVNKNIIIRSVAKMFIPFRNLNGNKDWKFPFSKEKKRIVCAQLTFSEVQV